MTGAARALRSACALFALNAVLACACADGPDRETRDAPPRAQLRGQNAATADAVGATAITAAAAPAGIGLDGAGMRVGVWDDAHARDSHFDLRGRVRRRDLGGFSPHATHTTGTLAGDGRRDARARGMAPAVHVWSYDWLLDLPELEAAASALSVTSHAYGPTLGWSIEDACPKHPTWHGAAAAREDASFGRYGQAAAALDAIALRTDLLTVWPAGNEREDRGPEPGQPHYHVGSCSDLYTDRHASEQTLQRDTLAGTGVAKNALTVGGVRALSRDALGGDRIVALDASGFGPTDDGRIKPELVAPGDGVRSTSVRADDAYSTATGTSSATAATAGALTLLAQLYRQLYQGSDPRAAELKALLVHTARDAGEPGPDVGTGFGLLDAQAAAELLVDDAAIAPGGRHLIVSFIEPGEMLQLRSTSPLAEDAALRVTLAWTDPPAEPARDAIDDRSPTLVDDLDLAVRTPDGREHLPWSLDLEAGARARRDRPNPRDNLEVVDVDASGARDSGVLQVSVRAPAALRRGGPRAFALVSSVPLAPPARPVLTLPRYVDAVRAADATRAVLHAQVGSRAGSGLAFSAQAREPWLAVSPERGEAPAELTIEVDLEALGDAREALGSLVIESDDPSGARVLAVVLQDSPCEPVCASRECGADARCGIACGHCQPTQACNAGRCVAAAESCPSSDEGDALGVAFVQAWPTGPGVESGSCMAPSSGESSFRWQAPEPGRYAISARGSDGDTALYARQGDCRGDELACDHDSSGIGPAIGLTLDAGESVILFADTFDDDLGQPITLSIEHAPCPSVSLGSRVGQGIAIGATEGGIGFLAGSCGGAGSEEARFAWTAPYPGTFRFALFDPAYQAVLYVRDGDCDGEELGCSVATDVGPVEVALDAGQAVAVIVDGRDGRKGPFTLDIVDVQASCDGACDGASPDGRCACDAECVAAGDCCADACELCGACRCERSCQGKRCGPDGCGGECGACGPGLACEAGSCVPDPCAGVRCDACEACTDGRCEALPEGAACEDGEACTVLDACERGTCVGVARDCDDGVACTLDRCDEASGRCLSRASAECCDGGPDCESAALPDGGPMRPAGATSDGCSCALSRHSETRTSALSGWLLAVTGLWHRGRLRRIRAGGRTRESLG